MRIVIVDDNISYLKIMCEYLSHIGEFEVVGTAEKGLKPADDSERGA